MSVKITGGQFADLVARARSGETGPLHQFLQQLYQKGKQSLLGLARSEAEAEEYFASAVARFWEKFVADDAPLPQSNLGGYIYTMAKFLCLDQKRTAKTEVSLDGATPTAKDQAEVQKTEQDFREEDRHEQRKKEAMRRAIAGLGDHCRQLFHAMLEKGLEKPGALFAVLGLRDARAVTVLRYECTRQLKVKAAMELESLIREERKK